MQQLKLMVLTTGVPRRFPLSSTHEEKFEISGGKCRRKISRPGRKESGRISRNGHDRTVSAFRSSPARRPHSRGCFILARRPVHAGMEIACSASADGCCGPYFQNPNSLSRSSTSAWETWSGAGSACFAPPPSAFTPKVATSLTSSPSRSVTKRITFLMVCPVRS